MPQTDASLESELLPKSWVLAEILGFDGRTGTLETSTGGQEQIPQLS